MVRSLVQAISRTDDASFAPSRLHRQLVARLHLAMIRGNLFQAIAYFLRREPQFVILLQVHPDAWPCAEPLAEAQGRVP